MDVLKQHDIFYKQDFPQNLGTKAAVLWLSITSLTIDKAENEECEFSMFQLKRLTGESVEDIFRSFRKLQNADLVFGSYSDDGIKCIIRKLY